jgi:hypothetical protein
MLMFARSLIALGTTFCGLAKVAIFITNVNVENQTLINHKCVCGVLNPYFCQTPVLVAQLKYREIFFLRKSMRIIIFMYAMTPRNAPAMELENLLSSLSDLVFQDNFYRKLN